MAGNVVKKNRDNRDLPVKAKADSKHYVNSEPLTPQSSKDSVTADKTVKDCVGPVRALPAPTMADPIVPINNLPEQSQLPDGIPDEYKFEIFRLRRQIVALSNDLRYENARVTKALETLHDEIRFWELGIFQHQWETLGQIQRRLKHLEAIARALESPGPIALPEPTSKARKR